MTTRSRPRQTGASGLTLCQWAALQATADGLTSKEIAQQAGRHPETIRDHLSAAYRTLGARNAAHAVAIAIRTGLITPPDPQPGHEQGHHRTVTPSDQEFAQLYEDGMKVPELALAYDTTTQQVRQRLARLKVPPRKGPRPLTGPARATVRHLLHAAYTSGASIRQLSNDTGRSFGAIHRLLTEAGTELRPRGYFRPK